MCESIINRLVDGFMETLRIENISYRRLVNGINSRKLRNRIYNLNCPTDGLKLSEAFRMTRMDMRFGTAKIQGVIQNIILIDIKFSGYEREAGRYIVYTLTEVGPNLYHVNYCHHVMHRLPNHWEEHPGMGLSLFQ